jgi:hypothetical protein
MIDKLIDAVLKELKTIKTISQTEFYEGQFENPEDFIILPPAVFVEAAQGNMTNKVVGQFEQNIRLYLITGKMKGIDSNSMYLLLDTLRAYFHNKTIIVDGNCYYLYVSSWNNLATFPGLCGYEMILSVEV